MEKKTIRDIDVYNKRVLLRVDFNVPIVNGEIQDDNRIVEAIPTIKYLLENGAALIIASHLGRPDGKVNKEFSLQPCAKRLSELLGKEVLMAKDCVGTATVKQVKALKSGEILLLENIRFYPEEEENTKEFCVKLSKLADVFVFDAFGTAHRKHASTYGISKIMPSAIGFLVEKELKMITENVENPKRPFVAIMGGAKVIDKIGMIKNLFNKADTIIIGGAMAYSFLKAKGYNTGKFKVDKDSLKEAKKLLKDVEKTTTNIVLPIDFVVTDNFKNPTLVSEAKTPNIGDEWEGVDIGPRTRKIFAKIIKRARTLIWNGPMGVFENAAFAKGTFVVAKGLAKNRGIKIVGGGDSASAVIQMGFAKKMTHISTGGGASLKLFEGGILPAVDVISNK